MVRFGRVCCPRLPPLNSPADAERAGRPGAVYPGLRGCVASDRSAAARLRCGMKRRSPRRPSPDALPAEAGDIHGAERGGGGAAPPGSRQKEVVTPEPWNGDEPGSRRSSGDSASTPLEGCGCERDPLLGTPK